jgi:hypothetical protein
MDNHHAVRKTMVIDDALYARAVKRARALCFPSFSDYLQALFRKDAGLSLENDTPPTERGGGGGGGVVQPIDLHKLTLKNLTTANANDNYPAQAIV